MTWSNGMVEGFVNKVKWIKRSSYGQAGFPLLQRRVLLHPKASEALSKEQRRRSCRRSALPPHHDARPTGSLPISVPPVGCDCRTGASLMTSVADDGHATH